MTPHEKAKDIYQKMFNNMPHPDETNAAVFTITKQCALIAVNEIIAANPIAFDEEDNCIAKQWWQEVKTEIEKI